MSRADDIREGDVRDRLRALRVDPPDSGFASSLRERLVTAGPPDQARPWTRFWRAGGGLRRWGWPAVGVATAVATFLVFTVVREGVSRSGGHAADAVAVVEVPSTRVALVRLNLSAEVAVASADLEISLPQGLVFWSDGAALAQRTFEWKQPLAAGMNEIPIAVRGERPGRYTVKVTARIGSTVIEHEVPLEVTSG